MLRVHVAGTVRMRVSIQMHMRTICMIVRYRHTRMHMAMGNRDASNEELNDDQSCNGKSHADLVPSPKHT